MFPYMPLTIMAKVSVATLEMYMTHRQRRRFHPSEGPSARISSLISLETFHRAQAYCRAKASFSMISASIDMTLQILTLYFFLLPKLWNIAVTQCPTSELRQTYVFCTLLAVMTALIELPTSLYSTFILEARFGFNRTSFITFITDRVKDAFLSALLGFPFLTIIFYILRMLSAYNVFTAACILWLIFSSNIIIMLFLYPNVIAPMFNKFTPLPAGPLKDRLSQLSEKLRFSPKEIYVIDGSRRSQHSNAYITGFPRKYICVYDTLLQQLPGNDEQTVAIVCHELGHWMYSHLVKQLAISLIHLFLTLLLYVSTAGNEELYRSFGFKDRSPLIIGLMLFNFLLSPLDDLLQPLQNVLSRRFEFQADAFARINGFAKPLADALIRMSVDNLSNMAPDKLYSTWNYSHPTLLERLDALNVSPSDTSKLTLSSEASDIDADNFVNATDNVDKKNQ